MKRIYSLDLLRGIAIFFVIALHEWEDTFNMNSLRGLTFADVNPVLAFFGFFMFILGHSRSFFLFISMIIHSYILSTQFERSDSLIKRRGILLKNTITGFALYVFGIIQMIFLTHDGFLLTYRKTGRWDYSLFNRVYEFDTLQMIGVSIILLTLFFYGLYYHSQWKHETWHSYLFGLLGLTVIYLSPFIRTVALTKLIYIQAHADPRLATFLVTFILPLFWSPFKGEEAMFPYLGVTFIGAVIGIELARPLPSMGLPLHTAFAGVVLINLGFIQWYFFDHMQMDLWFGLAPTWFILLDLGLELVFVSFFFWKIDFNPTLNSKRFLKRTTLFRRWGVVSLSIFMLQIIDVIPREILGWFFHVNFYQGASLYWSIFMIIIVLLYWDFLLKLWERVNFTGSWEWVIITLSEYFLADSVINKRRLHAKEVIYESEQINFALLTKLNPKT